MGDKIDFNQDLGNIAMSALIIEKVHNCADCPIRKLAVAQSISMICQDA